MAEKTDLLQVYGSGVAAGAGSSRESSPDEHRIVDMMQHSMDSLILSGESSDDILIDEEDYEEEEEEEEEEVVAILASGEDEEAIVETEAAGILSRPMAEEEEGAAATGRQSNSTVSTSSRTTTAGGGVDQEEENKQQLLADEEGQQARKKKKRRVSRTRERKISISSSRLKMEVLKEGYLTQQGGSFQRWNKRFMAVTADHLYISKEKGDKLREEIFLKDVTVAENSTKNINHSFTVLTPFQQVCLAANSRKEMEEWISAFKLAAVKSKHSDVLEPLQHLEGQHSWFACSHGRPTYCNVCGEALHGMAWNGLSCEICKYKSHRRCVFRVDKPCKWTTRSSLKNDKVQLGQDFTIPHQWMEGNLPNGSKCFVCERACGSARRLKDFRCLWCKLTVHTECKDKMDTLCTLGELRLSILPPSALQRSDAIRDGMWEPYKVYGHSPVLAFVNSKSGDNQGVKFIRRLKYWLNPAQVFDLAISGPELGVQLFQRFEKFRVIVLGGDGSIGWVLSTLDKYNLHSKCMIGVVPLGTGNDMARVLGWGAQCHDEEKIPTILSEMEQSSFKLMDRWSIQFSTEPDLDISSMISAITPISRSGRQSTESLGSSSPTKSIGTGTRRQPIAPFPGPSTGSSNERVDQAGDSILSPANSVFSSQSSTTSIGGDHEQEKSHDHATTTILEPYDDVEVEVEITGVDEERDRQGSRGSSYGSANSNGVTTMNANEQLSNGRSEKNGSLEKTGGVKEQVEEIEEEEERVGSPQDVAKIEAFHDSLAYHFSTILLSENATEVVSYAQILGQLVKEFMTSVIAGMEMQLSPSEFQNQPLVQKCSVLQDKLNSLLANLKEEVKNGSTTFTPDTSTDKPAEIESRESVSVGSSTTSKAVKTFRQREALMSRANSLKKAMQSVLDATEKVLDMQAEATEEIKDLGEERTEERDRVGDEKRGQSPIDNTTSGGGDGSDRPMMSLRIPKDSISSVVDIAPLLPDMTQLACMNNYFGIGLGAKIAYQFSNSRTKSRTKNRMLYLTLGGKEFFANSQRYLERRIQLECDGEPVKLPQRLQGVVFLNIPSYMAGTNFWGTEREKDGFSAPSHDDKLVEVVGITGFSHLATAKVLGIQNQRLAQCRFAKINFLGPDKVAVQVDGEAWLQEPGTIVVSHKNKARMLFKSKAFSQSLESWKQKTVQGQHSSSCPQLIQTAASSLFDVLSSEELERYREVAASVGPLIKWIKKEAAVSPDIQKNLIPYAATLSHSKDRVFKESQVSQTADVEHLQDFEKDVKALLQETLWFLNMHKISAENEQSIRDAVNAVETRMRRVLTIDLSACSQAHHGFRRASDTLIMSKPVQPMAKYSPTLAPHRERAVQVVPDATMEGASIAKKIGKEVVQWDIADVCRWLEELGLGEYCDAFQEQAIVGTKLLGLRKSDLQNLGVVKVGQLTRLWRALQALTGSSPVLLRTSISKDSIKVPH